MAASSPPAPPDLATWLAAESANPVAAAIARLQATSAVGMSPGPLRGRNIGILCDDPDRPEAAALQRAAGDLGARVALVNSNLHGEMSHPSLVDTARVLERLYDAVICVDLDPQVIDELRGVADIPVLSDVTAQWRALQALQVDAGDNPRWLIQALLAPLCS